MQREESEYAHVHTDTCEHDHTHEHTDACEHDHPHVHTDACEHDHNDHHAHANDVAGHAIHVTSDVHETAIVVSASLCCDCRSADEPGEVLRDALTEAGENLREMGAIIGHIKSSCAVTHTDFISVTEETTMSRASCGKLNVQVAAIVFAVSAPEAEKIIQHALQAVYESLTYNAFGDNA